MSNWNIRASMLFVLGCLVILMLVIVVLPDVDLPDTAFHRGTAPVVVHARANSAPAVVIVASIPPLYDRFGQLWPQAWTGEPITVLHSASIPILLQSIRC